MKTTAKQTDGSKESVERSSMERKKRNEIFLIGGILAFALFFFTGYRLLHRQPATSEMTAEVTVDGTVVGEFPLSQDIDFVIESPGRGTNHLVIRNGKASVTEASCPDKICVRQGAVSESGQTIVCLPNRVVVTIK